MSDRRLPQDEHAIDAMIEAALSGTDDRVLDTMNDAGFDRAIGSLTELLAVADAEYEPMPESLTRSCKAAIERAQTASQRQDQSSTDARISVRTTESSSGTSGSAGPDLAPEPIPFAQAAADTRQATSAWAVAGWLAAAACLLLAVAAWWPSGSIVTNPLTPAQQYAALADKLGVIQTSWVGLDDVGLTETPHQLDQQLTGEVLWDPETQTGFMKFTGLAANEADEFQYQLWIFDATRRTGDLPQFAIEGFPDLLTQRPVDGGVFDASTGEFVIPINAKLPVGEAALFAITKEPPGGVVVSDRDIVTLAVVQ